MHGAGATPLVAATHRRLELQQSQDILHRDPLAEQAEVYAWHGVTSSPVNRGEEPVRAARDAPWLSADSTVRLARRGRTFRGTSAVSAPAWALPGRQASRVVHIRHRIVAVRRIKATRAILAPRRRLIR